MKQRIGVRFQPIQLGRLKSSKDVRYAGCVLVFD